MHQWHRKRGSIHNSYKSLGARTRNFSNTLPRQLYIRRGGYNRARESRREEFARPRSARSAFFSPLKARDSAAPIPRAALVALAPGPPRSRSYLDSILLPTRFPGRGLPSEFRFLLFFFRDSQPRVMVRRGRSVYRATLRRSLRCFDCRARLFEPRVVWKCPARGPRWCGNLQRSAGSVCFERGGVMCDIRKGLFKV